MCVCVFIVLLYFVLFAILGLLYFCSVFPSVLWYFDLLTRKTASQITYTVLVETPNLAQSSNQSVSVSQLTDRSHLRSTQRGYSIHCLRTMFCMNPYGSYQ